MLYALKNNRTRKWYSQSPSNWSRLDCRQACVGCGSYTDKGPEGSLGTRWAWAKPFRYVRCGTKAEIVVERGPILRYAVEDRANKCSAMYYAVASFLPACRNSRCFRCFLPSESLLMRLAAFPCLCSSNRRSQLLLGHCTTAMSCNAHWWYARLRSSHIGCQSYTSGLPS